MIHTTLQAHTYHLTRRVLMIAHSKEEGCYKVQVEVCSHVRSEMNYYFIPDAATAQQACDQAADLATERFLGVVRQHSPVKETVKQIESAIPQTDKQEVSHGESNQESSEKSVKKSRSKKGSKESSQEVVADSAPSEAQPEEMEEVESPYTDTPSEESQKEEKVVGKKSTAEPYNREDKASKASFAVFATKLHKGSKDWKTNPQLKEISAKLHGMPFMEKDGSIHSDFEAKCKELFGIK